MKKNYMKPELLVVELADELCLGIVSGEANDDPAGAKDSFFDDEDEL